MSNSKKIELPLLAFLVAMGAALALDAGTATARSSVDRSSKKMKIQFVFASDSNGSPATVRSLYSMQQAMPFQIAGYDDEEDPKSSRPSAPLMPEVRGHDQEIEVRRRAATPIPRTTYSRKKKTYGGRPGLYPAHYYDRPRHRAHHVHVHHSHCGHVYREHGDYWGYGDAYESRTLGRSCIYGPKGEVIYKPADVICAPPDDEVTPAAAPRPEPDPATSPSAPAATAR